MKPFLRRFGEYPLPVLFAAFYMFLVWDVYQWVKSLPNPQDMEWIMNGFVAGAVAYFKFYTDLVMRGGSDENR